MGSRIAVGHAALAHIAGVRILSPQPKQALKKVGSTPKTGAIRPNNVKLHQILLYLMIILCSLLARIIKIEKGWERGIM